MSVRTREEIMEAVRQRFNDDTSDDTLTFIEDISDTLNNYENSINTEWETKYNELNARYQNLDNSWRQRYRERFFDNAPSNGETIPTNVINENKDDLINESEDKTFNDLFNERSESSGY